MCWACYTSLTGAGASVTGAAALVGVDGSIGATSIGGSDEKKKIDPKHLAIIGVGLLVAVGFGVNTMMSGGGGEEQIMDFTVDKGGSTSGASGTTTVQQTAPVASGDNPVGPGSQTSGPSGGGPTLGPPYRVVVSPHPRQDWGTMALVASDEKINEAQAKTYILDAKQKIEARKKFPAMEIFVITDQGAGASFARFQNRRKGAPLRESEYMDPSLSNVWSKTILRYVKNGKIESVTSPMRNPTGFWRERGR